MATRSDIAAQDGGSVRLVLVDAGDQADSLTAALAISGVNAVLVLAGDVDDGNTLRRLRLVQLVGRGLERAARDAGALCIVRGAAAGLGRLVGQAVADIDHPPPLLGVAPASQLTIPGQPRDGDTQRQPPAPGLSHLLLTPGADWGSELRTQCDVAQALAAGKPAMMVVIGGTASTPVEVLQAVRRRWPVLVVDGSGGAADDLARQWAQREADGDDPVTAEILADGNLTCITLGERVGEAVETMARQVLRQSGGDSMLRQAWRRFAAIDAAAVRQQHEFDVSQQWILALGLVAVALAIVQTVLPFDETVDTAGPKRWLHELLRLVLIVVPIGVSVLIAVSNRFKPGKRWVLLRSAAESIKREIYRFRLRALGYEQDETREKKLSETIEDITRRLARTEANTTALAAYAGTIPPPNAASERDDGLSQLSSDQYVRMRLEDQLGFYRRKTVVYERQLRGLQIGVLVAGAVGTLLAALGGAAVIWITLSSAVVGAVMTFLSYRQVETTLVNYNQTATDLENILSWWTALEPLEQVQRANIEALASHTEDVLANELAGWTQRMTDALEKLRDAQTKDGKDKDGAAAQDGTVEPDALAGAPPGQQVPQTQPTPPAPQTPAETGPATAPDLPPSAPPVEADADLPATPAPAVPPKD
jgi:hypothetical protein